MDKAGFVYSVNGLRAAGLAGKTLYRACTDVGQKRFSQQKSAFCTFAAVDMQAFFHRRSGFQAVDQLILPYSYASLSVTSRNLQNAVLFLAPMPAVPLSF